MSRSSAILVKGMPPSLRSRRRTADFAPALSGRPRDATAAPLATYSASATWIGSRCSAWAVRNWQFVWSSVPSRLRSSVPAGSATPAGVLRSASDGVTATIAMEGVGAA